MRRSVRLEDEPTDAVERWAEETMEVQEYCLLSVMGPHAGEGTDTIFTRKMADIAKVGRTFWVIRSHKAKPDMIQTILSNNLARSGSRLCAFLTPSASGGAVPTKISCAASEYSSDRSEWHALPTGLTPVTGQMSRNACAVVFDQLALSEAAVIDLWQYADYFNVGQPVTIRQGASTVGVVRSDTSKHPDRMKSNLRQVMAVGRLVDPFAVWVR